jgi:hypothetical protein
MLVNINSHFLIMVQRNKILVASVWEIIKQAGYWHTGHFSKNKINCRILPVTAC